MKKLSLLLIICAVCLLADNITAQTYVNSATGNDVSGNGSAGSPYKTFTKGYATVASGGTLDLTGTFTLTNTDETADATTSGFTIAKNITITGQGAGSTIIQSASTSNTADRRIFTISSTYTVTINNLTIRYGKTGGYIDGGGILNSGTLNMSNCFISYNYGDGNGGGISNGGSMTLTNCTVDQNIATYYTGGGIYNNGTLSINNCSINNNHSNNSNWGSGGGIYHVAATTLIINNSTINNNTTYSCGGGIDLVNYNNASCKMIITNTTIAYNSQLATVATIGGGGVRVCSLGTTTVTNCTIAYNNVASGTADGAGIYVRQGLIYIKNTIVANNTRAGGTLPVYRNDITATDASSPSIIQDNGYNIFGRYDNTYGVPITLNATSWYDANVSGTLDGTFTMQPGTPSGSLNLSATLADNSTVNGTQTLALSMCSIAVDAGTAGVNGSVAVPSNDQRGVSRVSNVDIGAYEYTGVSPNVTINPTTLTGFSYIAGNGPSTAQSFTISGTNLSNNLVLTAPTNYEISSGGAYTTAITLTQTSGTVTETTINVRLKSGLSAGSYNNQNITITGSCISQSVTCSGSVATPPTISSFTPTSAASGSTVTITGTNFTGATAVSFGGTPATSFSIVSATSITAVVANGTSGSVSITTPGGTASRAGFTYVLAPTITSFTPTSAATGATVTITGTNFTGATIVSFGGTTATSLSVVSATSITAVVASGTTGNVSVTTPGGTASLTGFTYIPTPTITSFTPTSAATGATVTITGTNFTGVTVVGFGGTAATSFSFVSATSITAVVASGTSGSVSVTTPGGTASLAGFTYITTGTWTGTSSSDWNTSTNWSPATVPTAATNVTIPDVVNDPIVNQVTTSPAICNNLTINSGAVLTIAAGKALTVNGTLTNSASGNTGLIINNGGSLIESTAGIAGTVNSAIPASEWHMISAPISDATSNLFLGHYLQTLNESTTTYTDITLTNNVLTPVKGYAAYGDAGGFTAAYAGTLNTGNQTYSTTAASYSSPNGGWNLVGNPYPCSIDWNAASGWTKTNVNNAIYVHRNSALWATFIAGVGANSGTQYIAPGQGFLVQSTAAGTLAMTNAVKVHNATTFFKNADEVVPNLLRIEVSGNGYKDEAVVRFAPEATAEFDGNYDAHKLYGDVAEAAQVYTLGSIPLAINSMPATSTVPLGIYTGAAGTYTLAATEINDLTGVTLEDTHTGIFTDLTKSPCSVELTAGESGQRFVLHFGPLSIEDKESTPASIYSYRHTAYISMNGNTTGDIFIYTISGQLVATLISASGMNEVQLPVSGTYIVKVIGAKTMGVKKVFIN